MLALTQTVTTADNERVYRLLAGKYNPDVRIQRQRKSIHLAYSVLSNEATGTKYDPAIKFGNRHYKGKMNSCTQFVEVTMHRLAKVRQKMYYKRYWQHYNVNQGYYSETYEDEERGSFSEMLRSAFMSLLLFQTLGSMLSLTFSSLMTYWLKDGSCNSMDIRW